ncbi:MAG TPA: hypothetical protein VK780_08100, partial [Thermoanaerobaculia bacterium]|nr:hypothetical protein [Thermoanaerobaculia bacterium]
MLTGRARALRQSSEVFRVAVGWTILAALALVLEYGPVRVCPRWGSCEKGPLFAGWIPFWITLSLWIGGILVLALVAPRFLTAPAREPAPPAAADSAALRGPRDGVTLVLCAVATLAAAHLFLLSPQIPRPFWAFPVRLSEQLSFPLNNDSLLLMDLAVHPEALLQSGPGDVRQSRPLYVWVTAGLTRALAPLARKSGLTALYGVNHPAFLPAIFLNWTLLTIALFLFWRFVSSLGGPFAKLAALLCSVPLLFNDVVKAFFWTPHMQMFNLLLPVLGMVLCRRMLAGPVLSLWRVPGWGAGLGSLALAYEGSLFILPAVAAADQLRARAGKEQSRGKQVILRPLLVVVGFALPLLLWMIVRVVQTGRFANIAVDKDRNFVWVFDSLRQGIGELFTRVASYFVLFLRSLWEACGFLIVPAVLLLFLALLLGRRPSGSTGTRREAAAAVWTTLFSAGALLFLMGQYLERHEFFLGPLLLALCGLWLTEILEAGGQRVRVVLFGVLAAL